MMLALGIFATIFAGACLQRVSGMGIGLVGGPVLMLILGPVQGILVVNVFACINAMVTTMTVRDHVDWRRFWLIAPVMVFGSIPAALLISNMDTGPLLIVVGGALVAALAVVTFGKRFVPVLHGPGAAISAGVLGGFTNTLAGAAGPVIAVYAQAARWPTYVYTATLQPIFFVGGLISVLVKLGFGAGGMASVDWVIWPAAFVGMFAGIVVGGWLAGKIDRENAHRLSLIVAVLGALSAMIRGVTQILGY
ncbi:sulfite exporter TauE/SafE family protein [Corynebacterium massiliense]|nr:sulfite exporter TauE/SafE family protein [Corynebacterium massiliense]